MNKVAVIPDLHGKAIWKTIIQKDDFDKIIFLGDYVDCFGTTALKSTAENIERTEKEIKLNKDIERYIYLTNSLEQLKNNLAFITTNYISNLDIISNLEEILAFKKGNADKVTLLVGNHDLHYFPEFEAPKCSGYSEENAPKLNKIFNGNQSLFTIAETTGNFLLSHAGVSEIFIKQYDYPDTPEGIKTKLNIEYLTFKDHIQLSLVSKYNGGMGSISGPFWQRPAELTGQNNLPFWQIVGHTPHDQITFDFNKNFIYTDCFNKSGNEFLTITNGQVKIGSI